MMKYTAITCFFLGLTTPALSADIPTMIRQAINEGQSTNEAVTGPVAEKSRHDLNATGQLLLKVKKVYDVDQPGCARLQLDFKQLQALPPGTTMPRDLTWASQINICLDGQPPTTTKRKDK